MADANVLAKIPQRYFDAWNGRDEHALDDFFASTFVWKDPLLPSPIDNLEGAQYFMTGSWEGFSDLRFELVGGPMIDEANSRVSQTWLMTGTNDGEFAGSDPTNNKTELLGTDVWTVDDAGQVTELIACYDSVTVLRDLGMF
ncbi:MAG: ester cyclase [Acidimicrobiia bacterium]